MKVIKKVLMTAMLFSLYTINIYATEAGEVVAQSGGSSIGKVILLLVGVGLVSLVLFLGYKMDKTEASDERKEKLSKKDRDLDDVYNTVYNSKTDISKEIDNIDFDEEDINIVDDEESLLTDEMIAEELERMAIEEAIKEAKMQETQAIETVVEDYEEDDEDEDEEVEIEDDDDDDDDYEEDDEEDDDEYSYNVKEDTGVFRTTSNYVSNSTMVFETDKLRQIGEKLNRTVDYNQEDDELDLSEIESSIKAANIKKYTRKKTNKKEKAKEKETKKDDGLKRFTRKKVKEVVEDIVDNVVEAVQEVKKPRRGRPTKAEAEEKARLAALNVQKPRRGRPPKKDKPKRGRPPKKVEKAKRGRPAKNTKKK